MCFPVLGTGTRGNASWEFIGTMVEPENKPWVLIFSFYIERLLWWCIGVEHSYQKKKERKPKQQQQEQQQNPRWWDFQRLFATQNISCLEAQSWTTFCDPMDYSPLGSSVHGIFHKRILEWVAIFFSRGFSWHRNWTGVSCIGGTFFTSWASRVALGIFTAS